MSETPKAAARSFQQQTYICGGCGFENRVPVEISKAAPDTLRKYEALAKRLLLSGIFKWQYSGEGNCVNDVADFLEADIQRAVDEAVRETRLQLSKITLERVHEAVAGAYLAAAERVRTVAVVHGDHYAAYYAPSNDAGELSAAILASMPADARCAFEEAVKREVERRLNGWIDVPNHRTEANAALLAELKATLKALDERSNVLTYEGRKAEAALVTQHYKELAAIIAKYEPKEKP